ncbi:MAG: tetratricopeptide repeat protein, partial [Candidatus Tisiphia sp.]
VTFNIKAVRGFIRQSVKILFKWLNRRSQRKSFSWEKFCLFNVKFLTQSFSGYPILIVQGTQLLNKIKGLDKEEYKKKIYQSTDKIATNISMAIQELKPSAVQLLNKIALLNNQSFSKQLLTIITDYKDTLDDDIYQLSKFMLISNINPNEDNPIFEMHDIVSNKIMELNGNNNKIYLENIISKIPKFKGTYSGYLWRGAKTIPKNLEILLKNSEEYNVDLYAILTLRVELFSIYMNTYNNKEQQMFDWFNQKDKNKEFKLWKMSESQKFCYARSLGAIGMYLVILENCDTAISYLTKSLNVLDKLDDDEANYSLKVTLLSYTSLAYRFLGEIKLAEEFLKKAEEVAKQGVIQEIDISIIYFAKSVLYEVQGKHQESLDWEEKVIELRIKNGLHINDPVLTGSYIFRAKILNSLGRYQEAYVQAQQLYDICKPIKNEDHEIFADIYTEMARSELGLGKIDKASEYINKAIYIFAANENNDSESTNYSKNVDLADSYIVQGDILFAQDNFKQAIKSYKKAFVIYHYLYGDRSKNIAQVSELYNKGAKAACKSKDLYNYKFFGKPQIKEFGIHHPNTVDMFEYCKQYNMDIWVKNN